MAKKAFLVTFEVTTRVVADVPDGFNPDKAWDGKKAERVALGGIVAQARKQIVENAEDKLIGDNVADLYYDEECPYGTTPDEREDAV